MMYIVEDDILFYSSFNSNFSNIGLETKYGLFNSRYHTISHCECDQRFRICLKMDGSKKSDLIGELFFDFLKIPCFILKKSITCKSKTWWGKCIERGENWTGKLYRPLFY